MPTMSTLHTILSLFDYIPSGKLHRLSTIKREAPIVILIFQAGSPLDELNFDSVCLEPILPG